MRSFPNATDLYYLKTFIHDFRLMHCRHVGNYNKTLFNTTYIYQCLQVITESNFTWRLKLV